MWGKLRICSLEGPRRRHPSRKKNHKDGEGKGNHLDFAENLGMDVAGAAEDSVGIGCFAAGDSSHLLFHPQIIFPCFFHPGHDQP
jgi:hypothetical protein